MKILISFIILLLSSSLFFTQKINTLKCTITYLPTIKNENDQTKFSKKEARKIDSLINLKTFEINLDKKFSEKFHKLYNEKDYKGKNLYILSDDILKKIKSENKIILNFNEIDSLNTKNFMDAISGVIDGAPFTLTAKTKINMIKFIDNLSAGPTLLNLREYLIFYYFFKEKQFCGNTDLIRHYFSDENMLKYTLYGLLRIDQIKNQSFVSKQNQ